VETNERLGLKKTCGLTMGDHGLLKSNRNDIKNQSGGGNQENKLRNDCNIKPFITFSQLIFIYRLPI